MCVRVCVCCMPCAVFYLKNWFFTLLALAVQCVTMALYALSYLPAGMGLGLVRRLLGL